MRIEFVEDECFLFWVKELWRATCRGRACVKKNSSLHIWPRNFSTTFFRILPKDFPFYLSKILMTFFSFSHRPFFRSSALPYFTHCPFVLFLNSTFYRRKFLDDLFYDLTPKLYILSLKSSDDFF